MSAAKIISPKCANLVTSHRQNKFRKISSLKVHYSQEQLIRFFSLFQTGYLIQAIGNDDTLSSTFLAKHFCSLVPKNRKSLHFMATSTFGNFGRFLCWVYF